MDSVADAGQLIVAGDFNCSRADNPSYSSCLDLTFVSSRLLPLCSCEVLLDSRPDDLCPIRIQVGIPAKLLNLSLHRPRYGKISATQWFDFQQYITS